MRNILFVFALLIAGITMAKSGFEFVGQVLNHKATDNLVEISLTNAKLNVYLVDKNVIRFRFTNQKSFSMAPSYSVIFNQKEKVKFSLTDEADKLIVATDELIVHIKKNPCRISIYDKNMNLINSDEESFGVSFDNDEVRCHKKILPNESFLGLGEKADENLFRNGKQFTMWNTDFPAFTSTQDPLYLSIPFFIGVKDYKAYGIFFDNTYKSYFNMGASNNRFYWFGADKGEMDYYFIYGPEIKTVVSDYTKLTGRMELPPKWSLGYQQSRWSYYPEEEVRTLAKNFRAKNIPCDVIYLDIHYMDGYRVFTWDKSRFPNPNQLLADLKKDGFKVIPIIDPGVKADANYFAAKEGLEKNLFATYPDGIPYQGEVWPSWAYFPDFTKQTTRDWWGKKLSAMLAQGVEGFWNDMNEPATWGQNFPDIVQFDDNGFKSDHKKIHNVYALEMARASREGLKKYSDKRHFILSRAGYAGIQRYAANWTGDNASTEEHLRLACVMPLGIGLSGQPFIGSDVGGFMGGEPSNELYVRWMQLGAFSPFFRGHSALDTKAREPFAFNQYTEDLARQAIQLRYKLLPFFYNEFYNSTQTGLPIMRAMMLNYQNDENCYYRDAQYQFMIGENLLVAPQLASTEKFKKFYLPIGNWIDFNSKEVVTGGNWTIIETPLNKIPIYLKEGGMIPMQDVQNFVGEKDVESMELHIFPAEKSEYIFYEDDGSTYKYKEGNFSVTNFKCSKNSKGISFTAEKTKNGYTNLLKENIFTFYNTLAPNNVYANGIKIPLENLKYDSNKKILSITVKPQDRIAIEINY